jgi:hypothetical protein
MINFIFSFLLFLIFLSLINFDGENTFYVGFGIYLAQKPIGIALILAYFNCHFLDIKVLLKNIDNKVNNINAFIAGFASHFISKNEETKQEDEK